MMDNAAQSILNGICICIAQLAIFCFVSMMQTWLFLLTLNGVRQSGWSGVVSEMEVVIQVCSTITV